MKKQNIFTLTTTLVMLSTLTFADINPKSGTWKSQIDANNITGCPSMMKSMISKQSIKPQSKKVTFSKPFHPKSLFEESGQLKWKKLRANKWQAVMQQGGEGMNVNITWSINIVSTTKMHVASKVNMQLPPQMAVMFGGSAECKADTTGSYNYTGK